MQVHECVSFLLIKDDMILLETRSQDKATDPGLIAIPGGHMESGETQSDTLQREIKEELNIEVEKYQYLCSLYHPTAELQLIHYYIVTDWSGEIMALEAENVNWYSIIKAPIDIEADLRALSELSRVGAYLLS
ncbi:NUDIX hydrolase [Vibrio viridaestus]|uniref:8-oxo-dGTP diphosphatase n=1 Tax=Vibrio viridaestus TaxID=2487322 RepID=A0A3N9U3D2_9VIBR|nr:NUDIX domain-containing protein [Vibrio viridaestus]RQW62546.1 NUDIX domain-containing protein [Vibrio viridaestus]